jgi:molybdenum cofactor cytidylyltransferase
MRPVEGVTDIMVITVGNEGDTPWAITGNTTAGTHRERAAATMTSSGSSADTHQIPLLGAVILCAGASTRMGFPKLMLDVGGRSAIAAIADVVLKELGGPIIVVTRPEDAEKVETAGLTRTDRVRAVVNPHPERGRTGSLQCGLRELETMSREPEAAHLASGRPGGKLTGCLIWPVDVPLVSAATVRLIAGALATEGAVARIVPVHEGRGGHPVAVGRDFWAAIHVMSPDDPLRNLFRQPGPPVKRIPVDDERIRANLDAPEDVERWLGRAASPWTAQR